jgi:hypothetical protein
VAFARAIITAVGCILGILPHLVAAVPGTSALLQASGTAFDVLKVAGVVYLLILAIRTWRDRNPIVMSQATPRSPLRMIAKAVVAKLLNPKLTLLFFAFLPQFVPRHATEHALPDRRVHGHDLGGLRDLRRIRCRGPSACGGTVDGGSPHAPDLRSILGRVGGRVGHHRPIKSFADAWRRHVSFFLDGLRQQSAGGRRRSYH